MKLRAWIPLAALALLAGTPCPARGQTSFPMITSVYPSGAQRGKSTEIAVTGRFNFAGAYGVLFESGGLTAEVPRTDPATATDTVTLKVTVAPDAPLGPQEFRVATPRGISTVGLLVIGDEPEIAETEPNNEPAAAGKVELPVTLNGRIQAPEDVDSYRFEARAGEVIVFSCLSGRLQDKIHDLSPGSGGTHVDPILVLKDAAGNELSTADDYYGPDPLLAHRFDKDGSYVLQIRDVRYSGLAGWTYRVTCTRGPYVTAVYPMAGQKGRPVAVQPVGYNLGGMGSAMVEIPGAQTGGMDLRLPAPGGLTNPVPFLVSEHPQVLETAENNTAATATPAPIPAGLNGRIETDNDVDFYRFPARKGRYYTFEVYSRAFGSTLDSVIQVLDGAGKVLASNDDPGVVLSGLGAIGRDSRLDWACPADGEYLLQVADLHSAGGETFVYHVSARETMPDFVLRCDDDKALVGPGSGYAMYVIAERRYGFSGEIQLSVEGLPPGVTATAGRVRANMTQACVLLQAAPDARPDFRRIRIVGSAVVPTPEGGTATIRREAVPLQEIYLPGGGRGRWPVHTHVVSVTEPADVVLKLSTTRVDLKPGGSVTIDVDVVRQKGYAKNVVLDVFLRHLGRKDGDPLPPGVTLDESASKTLLNPTETKGKITLKASADAAEIQDLPIAILGQVSINFVVKVSHASEPVFISVKK